MHVATPHRLDCTLDAHSPSFLGLWHLTGLRLGLSCFCLDFGACRDSKSQERIFLPFQTSLSSHPMTRYGCFELVNIPKDDKVAVWTGRQKKWHIMLGDPLPQGP